MTDLEKLIKTLQDRAIQDAAAIDPAFAEQVEADRAELAAHDKMLEASRLSSQQKTPPIELRKPKEDSEPGESEREILQRVNRAVIERRNL